MYTYLVALSVESMLKSDNIRMLELLHDLKFTILVSLVLVYFLDGNNFASLRTSSLVNPNKPC